MKSILLTTFLFFSFLSLHPALAQRPGSGHRDVHRDLERLEQELLSCLNEKEKLYDTIENLYANLAKVASERARWDGQKGDIRDRKRMDTQINSYNQSIRSNSIAQGRIDLEIDRIKLGIDKLTRIDSHVIEGGSGGSYRPPHDDHHEGSAPRVTGIKLVNTKQEGPVRVTGKGVGMHEITIYEVLFSNGSKQRVEDKRFIPNNR